MKIAIVHDWITGMRGGEWCLEAFLLLYPDADVFTLVHIPGSTTANIDAHVKQTSWLSRLPGVKKYYRALLPFFPVAVRSFDFKGYEAVITISHAAAKNIRVPSGVRHVCYCLTPMRYIWDQARQYLKAMMPLFWPAIVLLRLWDRHGAQSVTEFVAISRFVGARIRKFYKRHSMVVYPPVATEWLKAERPRPYAEKYFLVAGALVPYKRTELAIKACVQAKQRLIVAGDGPLREHLQKLAPANCITFEGKVSDERLAALYQHCEAFLFLAEEDFGIMPIEALGAGSPVVARFVGAARETIDAMRPWEDTAGRLPLAGVFLKKTIPATSEEIDALIAALQEIQVKSEGRQIEAVKKLADPYSPGAFYRSWCEAVGDTLKPQINEGNFVAAYEKARFRVG